MRMPEQFRKVRGRLGLLEKLAKDVPLDVILEIFCYLEPGDLLRLARTTKELRGILMSKTSESIWRTARENVEGLPPRPNDLNEPQYAHLCYESYCHVCNHRGRCDTVLWTFRMRACKACAANMLNFYGGSDADGKEYMIIMSENYEFRRIFPNEVVKTSSRHRFRAGNLQIAKRLKTEYDALTTPEDQADWINRKALERQEIASHALLCQKWLESKLQDRSTELYDIRQQRKEAILIRLDEIGWREEAEYMIMESSHEFLSHKAIHQTKKLTDIGWNRMKDELVQLLSQHKTTRLAEELRAIRELRYSLLLKEYKDIQNMSDQREPFPPSGDIVMNKIFYDLVSKPVEEDLTAGFFKSQLSQHLPRVLDEWRSAKTKELVKLMQKSRPEATEADLHLPTTLFECQSCPRFLGTIMHFPQMFYHTCFTRTQVSGDNHERLMAYHSRYAEYAEGPWMADNLNLLVNEARLELVKTITKACSLDPNEATVEDLDLVDPLIECVTCAVYGGRLFMRWPSAVCHDLDHVLVVNSFGEETENILAQESKLSNCSICCSHCHRAFSEHTIRGHLNDQHGVALDELPWCDSGSGIRLYRKHWYWNPCKPWDLLGHPFRYRPPPKPAVEPAAAPMEFIIMGASGEGSAQADSDAQVVSTNVDMPEPAVVEQQAAAAPVEANERPSEEGSAQVDDGMQVVPNANTDSVVSQTPAMGTGAENDIEEQGQSEPSETEQERAIIDDNRLALVSEDLEGA
ncbi:hypothetical protein BDP27DRAFT_1314336 [Rhodocollybia butyracea]|uniref:F-box domain-containing protein n=1 Tax=Rhodocollybia butyracea TaxID=206335 RepID=A0A9P5PZV8_9AGAR|nr:hypothetical protein BDP27DRAFT_1314336 [Rhodocollybia butyracea]